VVEAANKRQDSFKCFTSAIRPMRFALVVLAKATDCFTQSVLKETVLTLKVQS
jgi:hypothetical protein